MNVKDVIKQLKIGKLCFILYNKLVSVRATREI